MNTVQFYTRKEILLKTSGHSTIHQCEIPTASKEMICIRSDCRILVLTKVDSTSEQSTYKIPAGKVPIMTKQSLIGQRKVGRGEEGKGSAMCWSKRNNSS